MSDRIDTNEELRVVNINSISLREGPDGPAQENSHAFDDSI